MPLVDTLKENYEPRKPTVPDFFTRHPDLIAEVVEAREAGFTWPQIADALERDYGFRPNPWSLGDYVTGQ